MVILVVFKVSLLVKNLEILIQIVPDSPIHYYSPLNITLLVPSISFEKFGLTTLQKCLLSVMRLTFKET